MGAQGLVSDLQSSDCLFAGNGREGIQEFVEAVPAFQIINEIPKRNARPAKHRRPAENLRIAMHDRR